MPDQARETITKEMIIAERKRYYLSRIMDNTLTVFETEQVIEKIKLCNQILFNIELEKKQQQGECTC